MAGFIISINQKELVSVSNEGLNILSVQVAGDVVGEELAELNVFGGYYGSEDKDKHLIWISDEEVKKDDEIEIKFLKFLVNSYPGKTIEEICSEGEKKEKESQSMEELFEDLKDQPSIREKYSFKLTPSFEKSIFGETLPEDYSFILGVMWKRIKSDTASVRISSNTLEGIRSSKPGKTHARVTLSYGQSIKLCIGT